MKTKKFIGFSFSTIMLIVGYLYYKNFTEIIVKNALPYSARVSVRYIENDSAMTLAFYLHSGEQRKLEFTGLSKSSFSIHFNPAFISDVEFREWTRKNSFSLVDSVIYKYNLQHPVWRDLYKRDNLQLPLADTKLTEDYVSGSFKSIEYSRKKGYKRQNTSILIDPVFQPGDEIILKANNTKIDSKEWRIDVLNWKFALLNTYEKKGHMVVVNATPYKVEYVVNYPSISLYKGKSSGYYTLGPGERKEFFVEFKGETPSFQVSAKTIDYNLVHFATNGITSEIYFQDEKGSTAPVNSIDAFTYEYQKNQQATVGNSKLFFSKEVVGIFDSITGRYKANYYFVDNDNSQLLSVDGSSEEDFLNNVKNAALQLNSSFKKQMTFLETHSEPCKYNLGLNLADLNRNNNQGIWIKEVVKPINQLGQQVPFMTDDIVLSINGESIFSSYDLGQVVCEHANTKSIEKPLKVIFQRGDNIYETEVMFAFNHQHSELVHKNESFKAFLYAAADGISLGTADNLARLTSGGISYTNTLYRLREKHPKAFAVGTIGGSILSPGRIFLLGPSSKILKRLGISSKGTRNLIANITLENLENSAWSAFGNRHPLTSDAELHEELRINASFSIVLGVGISIIK